MRRRRRSEHELTPEGHPIRETRYGRFYQVPGERCWRGVETPEESAWQIVEEQRHQERCAPIYVDHLLLRGWGRPVR